MASRNELPFPSSIAQFHQPFLAAHSSKDQQVRNFGSKLNRALQMICLPPRDRRPTGFDPGKTPSKRQSTPATLG
jgi:hypothetical protein